MVVVDTSIWVNVFRDASGETGEHVREFAASDTLWLTRFTQLELLQGARDESEWGQLAEYLSDQDYVDIVDKTWPDAARIYFDLRRRGLTVRSPIDCCIAQLCIEHDALLLHRDRDFEVIASIRPLRERRL